MFKGHTARRLYKSLGVKGLIFVALLALYTSVAYAGRAVPFDFTCALIILSPRAVKQIGFFF
jgi:hypothetical protein